MKKTWLSNVALLLVAVLFVPASHAEDNGDARADSLVSISLTDGTQLEGTITQETETHILVETLSGLEIKVPRTSIVAIKKRRAGAFSRPDPNYTRLMFAPTGRPLRRGDRYFFILQSLRILPRHGLRLHRPLWRGRGPVRYSGVGIERANSVAGPQVRPLR